ncbi:MAG TPA: glycosyltransferase [Flavitalea sp.]|nr:glycosyltransferase [Flavitalea sp.]
METIKGPDLSIIIPTLNRYSELKNTLHDLSRQSFINFEIIIVDQSPDKTPIESDYPFRICYYTLEELSASAARNIGIKKANGRILLFLDDDIIIRNTDFLANHMRHFEDSSVPGVAGCILELDEVKRTTRHRWSYNARVGWLFFPRNYAFPAQIHTGGSGNLSIRRDWAIEAGGMDENYVKGAHREESDFCQRVVKRHGLLTYDPDADIVHIGSPAGGIRTWNNRSDFLKKQQHYDGAMYFLVRYFSIVDLPYHAVATIMFFFYDKRLLRRPHLIFVSFFRALKGLFRALKLARHPRYLSYE